MDQKNLSAETRVAPHLPPTWEAFGSETHTKESPPNVCVCQRRLVLGQSATKHLECLRLSGVEVLVQ